MKTHVFSRMKALRTIRGIGKRPSRYRDIYQERILTRMKADPGNVSLFDATAAVQQPHAGDLALTRRIEAASVAIQQRLVAEREGLLAGLEPNSFKAKMTEHNAELASKIASALDALSRAKEKHDRGEVAEQVVTDRQSHLDQLLEKKRKLAELQSLLQQDYKQLKQLKDQNQLPKLRDLTVPQQHVLEFERVVCEKEPFIDYSSDTQLVKMANGNPMITKDGQAKPIKLSRAEFDEVIAQMKTEGFQIYRWGSKIPILGIDCWGPKKLRGNRYHLGGPDGVQRFIQMAQSKQQERQDRVAKERKINKLDEPEHYEVDSHFETPR